MSIPFLSKTEFKDNVQLTFGDSEDLRIYHNGSASYIADVGTGSLLISGTNLHLNDSATGESFFRGTSNGAVQLYYDGAEKFITTSTGIDVTGTVNLDNLTINGGQGSDGQVLTSTGSGVAWEDAASGGGTVTSVGISPGTGLDVSGSPVTGSGNITLNLDLSEFTDMTGDIDASVDEIILLDNGSERRKRFAEIFGSNAYNSTTIPTNNNQLTNGAGYITSFTNYYLDGITKSGNTLTFSVNGTDDQDYTFGSNAFTSTTIPTNNNQLTNGAGYITDGNTGWNNTYGFITASSSDTLTNKGGNISQWTNDSGYITSSSLPTVNNGTLTLSTSAGLDGSASFTANQSGTSTFTVSLDLSELTDMTGAVDTAVDEIILLDNGAERRKRFAEIFGSNAYNSTTIPTNNNQLTNGAGYITSFTNYYLDNITKSGNTLTFSVNGTTNQSYTFGSNAFNSTTIPTNNNQLTNGAGYITGYTETDTLASVVARGASTSSAITTGDITVSGGDIYLNDTNTRLTEGSGNSIRLQTNSGYIDVGPQNTTYAHIQTDRGRFYFNKEIQVDTGSIRSHNEDLNLNRAGSSTARLVITDGLTRTDQNMRIVGTYGNDAVLTLKDGNGSGYIGSEINFTNTSDQQGARIEYLSNPGASEMRIFTEGHTSTNSIRIKTDDSYFNNRVHADQFIGQTYVITGSVDHTFQNSSAYWWYNWHQSTSFSSVRYAENSFVVPFDGYLGRLYHRGVGLDSTSATTMNFRFYVNGSYSSISGYNVTKSGSGSNVVFEFINTSSTSYDFNEGDRIEIGWNINAIFGESCYAVELVRKTT